MVEEKHSDKIFRDKLENFSIEPPAHVWTGIQDQLAKKRRSRRIVILRWISAAAAILLAFLGGWYFNHNSGNTAKIITEESIVQQNKNSLNEEIIPESKVVSPVTTDQKFNVSSSDLKQSKTITRTQTIVPVKPDEKILVSSSQNMKKEPQKLILIKGREPNFNAKQNKEIQFQRINQFSDFTNELTENDLEAIAGNTSRFDSKRQNESRWKLGMMVSPGYSSQVASHSQIYASEMTYSASNGYADVTGGISVQLRTGNRWSIESGVYYDQNGQKSQHSLQMIGMFDKNSGSFANANHEYYSNNINVQNGSVVMNSIAGIIAFDKTPVGTEISGGIETSALSAPQTLISSGDFSQVFDFVEIPFYLRYKLINSRFGVEMVGGLNAAMLVSNNAYIDNEYGLQNIGKTRDISPFNISGTLGFGLDYQLGKHFSLAAEPRFNYFLSSISNNPDVNFRPYRFGIYTGVYYGF